MKDDEVRKICTGILGMAGYIKHLQDIVDRMRCEHVKRAVAYPNGR